MTPQEEIESKIPFPAKSIDVAKAWNEVEEDDSGSSTDDSGS